MSWRTNADGSLVCPHRELSVCPDCAAHPDVIEVEGAHFHDPHGTFRHVMTCEKPIPACATCAAEFRILPWEQPQGSGRRQ